MIRNNELIKEVKQKVNFIDEANYQAKYQYEDSKQCQVIPFIIFLIQLDDQIMI